MPYTTKPRSSQQDYTPERRHFTQKNVSQVFAEDPKAKSTKEGLPKNPTYKSQEMGDILSGTPDHNNTTYRSPKKQVEPPKEREPATPGRKKVVDKPQGHGYEEILNPKPAPLEDRRVKKTQVGTLLENNEHPDTEALQEPPRSERKHFKTPIQPDENYFSEAKALAYDRRNNSRKVIIASDETPYSEKKCIDELASKLAKALGRKKPVPPPETPIPSTHHITRVIYTGNKRQVIYEPQTSKRPEQSATSRAEGSPRAPSATEETSVEALSYRVAQSLTEENSAAKRATRLAAKAQQGFDSRPQPSSKASATSEKAAASSRKAGSVSSIYSLPASSIYISPVSSSTHLSQTGYKRYGDTSRFEDCTSFENDLGGDLRSENKELTRIVDQKIEEYQNHLDQPKAEVGSEAGSARSIISPQPSSKASAPSAEAGASSVETARAAGAKSTTEEEAKEAKIQKRIKAQKERAERRAEERRVDEEERKEAQKRAERRAERRAKVTSVVAHFYSTHTPDTIKDRNEQIERWQQKHTTDSDKCNKTDKFIKNTKEEVDKAQERIKKNISDRDKQIERLDTNLKALEQDIRPASTGSATSTPRTAVLPSTPARAAGSSRATSVAAGSPRAASVAASVEATGSSRASTGSAVSAPSASGTRKVLDWREKVSQGTDSTTQIKNLSLTERLKMRSKSIEAGTDSSPGR